MGDFKRSGGFSGRRGGGGGGFERGGSSRPSFGARRPSFGGGERSGFGSRRPSFGGGERSSFDRNHDESPREMFRATCAKCQKSCQVPFRPTGEKPVYCSECFGEKQENFGGHERRDERPRREYSNGRDERPRREHSSGRDDREQGNFSRRDFSPSFSNERKNNNDGIEKVTFQIDALNTKMDALILKVNQLFQTLEFLENKIKGSEAKKKEMKEGASLGEMISGTKRENGLKNSQKETEEPKKESKKKEVKKEVIKKEGKKVSKKEKKDSSVSE
ncbi:MAG: hypothetical protein IPN70_00125 [Candidatus Moraniibacteriota bacterium]|nr:MAG: hypothetical protein IPN70_00125 [Candidatus Moranbacteria bacterium]